MPVSWSNRDRNMPNALLFTFCCIPTRFYYVFRKSSSVEWFDSQKERYWFVKTLWGSFLFRSIKPECLKFLGSRYQWNWMIPDENTDLQNNTCPNQLQLTILFPLLRKFNSDPLYKPKPLNLHHFKQLFMMVIRHNFLHKNMTWHKIRYIIYSTDRELMFQTFLDTVGKRYISAFQLISHS
jgi:hypothetical protein